MGSMHLLHLNGSCIFLFPPKSTRQPKMSLNRADHDKMDAISNSVPQTRVFLRPIAPPAALGLAGFAGSTWITASWIAGWWGTAESPPIFGPFVAFWGGLAQFIAGIFGFWARDTLATVIHTMWGAFWMSNGLLFFLMVRKHRTAATCV